MVDNLYDESLLADLELNAPEGLKVRPLRRGDFKNGFLEVLGQLSPVADVTEEKFNERYDAMKAIKDHYFVTVMEDTVTSKIIAMSSLAIELKFIHNCGLRGRLEDVVVHEAYRGKYLGKAMVRVIIQLARRIGCYKLTLDCKDKYITFYESMGFQCEPENSNTLAIRF